MRNIVIIGMSGVGKNEVGKELAQQLHWNFLDTDQIIVEQKGISIDEIFQKYGEEYFREWESKVVSDVSKENNTIISTGGGVVLKEENIEKLRQNGYIFLLMGKIDTIVENLHNSTMKKPLFKDSLDLKEKVNSLFKSREHLYLISSDCIVNIDDKSLDEIIKEIIIEYEKLNKRFN